MPVVRKPSAEHVFYWEWGRETLKDSIATLNSTFRLFIMLDTVLLSAYLGFYDKLVHSPSCLKVIPAALVAISFITSIVGIYPFAAKVDLRVPQKIKAYKQGRAKFKGVCLIIAVVALLLGFASLLVARLLT